TGNDTVNVTFGARDASNIYHDTFKGSLTVNGQGGTDALNILDTVDPYPDSYTITSSTVTRTASATLTYGTMESLVVNGGNARVTYNVQSTAFGTPLTIAAGIGNDTFNIRPSAPVVNAPSLDTLQGAVTIHGNGGTDVVNVNDQADTHTGDVFTISSTSVSRT